MAVIDTVARRVLRPIFQLGLFENPYVDPDNAKATAGQRGVPGGRAMPRSRRPSCC